MRRFSRPPHDARKHSFYRPRRGSLKIHTAVADNASMRQAKEELLATVKDTAPRVGLPSRTLRYYDRIGLVYPPRTPAGYRVYGPEEEARLRFIRRAKMLGLSLAETRELLAVAEGGRGAEVAPEVERLLDAKISAIDAQMAELGAFRERLPTSRARGR